MNRIEYDDRLMKNYRLVSSDLGVVAAVLFVAVIIFLLISLLIQTANAADFDPTRDAISYQVKFWPSTSGFVTDQVTQGGTIDIEFTAPTVTMSLADQPNYPALSDTTGPGVSIIISNSNVNYTAGTGSALVAPITLTPGIYLWSVRVSNSAGWSKYAEPRLVEIIPKAEPPAQAVLIRIRTVVQ